MQTANYKFRIRLIVSIIFYWKLRPTNTDDACSSNPCSRGGNCVRRDAHGYACTCRFGFSGRNCEKIRNVASADGNLCKIEINIDYWGNDIGPIRNVETFSDCCKKCKQNGACKLYTWAYKGGDKQTCWLKKEAGHRRKKQPVISGTEVKSNCICEPSNDDACSSNPCSHGGTCVRRDAYGYTCTCRFGFSGRNCEQIRNVTSDDGNLCKIEINIDYRFNDIDAIPNVETFSDCCKKCKQNRACKLYSWAYNRDFEQTCWLKNKTENRRETKSRISGTDVKSNCICEPSNETTSTIVDTTVSAKKFVLTSSDKTATKQSLLETTTSRRSTNTEVTEFTSTDVSPTQFPTSPMSTVMQVTIPPTTTTETATTEAKTTAVETTVTTSTSTATTPKSALSPKVLTTREFPLSETEVVIVTAIQTLGCTFILAALGVTIAVFLFLRCWLNIGSSVAFASIGPVLVISAVTIIIAEAAGMGNHRVAPDGDRHQATAAIANSKGLFIIVPLSAASWFCGLYAVYHANIALYSVVHGLNVALGVAIFVFHSLGNPKITFGYCWRNTFRYLTLFKPRFRNMAQAGVLTPNYSTLFANLQQNNTMMNNYSRAFSCVSSWRCWKEYQSFTPTHIFEGDSGIQLEACLAQHNVLQNFGIYGTIFVANYSIINANISPKQFCPLSPSIFLAPIGLRGCGKSNCTKNWIKPLLRNMRMVNTDKEAGSYFIDAFSEKGCLKLLEKQTSSCVIDEEGINAINKEARRSNNKILHNMQLSMEADGFQRLTGNVQYDSNVKAGTSLMYILCGQPSTFVSFLELLTKDGIEGVQDRILPVFCPTTVDDPEDHPLPPRFRPDKFFREISKILGGIKADLSSGANLKITYSSEAMELIKDLEDAERKSKEGNMHKLK